MIFFLATIIMVGSSISVNAQYSTGGQTTTQKTTQKSGKSDKLSTSSISGELGGSFGWPRGFTLYGGICVPTGSLLHHIDLSLSVPPTKDLSYYTYIGAHYKIHPFQKNYFSRMWGFGLDINYGYRADWKAYSEFFFGGKVVNTFQGKGSSWKTKRLVVAPRIDFVIPFNNWELGLHTNPLAIVYFDYYPDEKIFGMGKRWFNFEVCGIFKIGSGKKNTKKK